MNVRRVTLVDFRSYANVDIELEPGVAAFVGPNGQGKTNLVEALGYLATLGSHRVPTDAPLVRAGAERAFLRVEVDREGRRLVAELEILPGKTNKVVVNGNALPRPREVLGLLRIVLFAPEDLSLVKGDPDGRRRFLDELLVARAPRLAGVRADYDRVLRQRNALLKSGSAARRSGAGADTRTLDVWDSHLARTGSELLAHRLELLAELGPRVAAAYADVAAGARGPAGLAYRSSLPASATPGLGPDGCALDGPVDRDLLAAALLAELAAVRSQELDRGVSLVGPHRDDLVLSIGELPAKGYASHGESWSLALALRLGSYELLRADGAEPVLLLDDVFAELDAGRRGRLAAVAGAAEQCLITAAVASDVPEGLAGARYDVMAGEVIRVR